MYIFRNALRNILRSPGRSLLIGIIVLLISFSSCIGLSIRQAAGSLKDSGLEGITVSATISLDRQAMMQNAQRQSGDPFQFFSRVQNISLEEMEKYAASKYVKDTYYVMTSSVAKGEGLEPLDVVGSLDDAASTDFQLGRPGQNLMGRIEDRLAEGGFRQGDFTIYGYSDEAAMQGFIDGTNKVSAGSMFDFATADYSCLVSDQVAYVNSIKVGDKIKVMNPSLDTEEYELTVAGTYSVTETDEGNSTLRFSNANDPSNQILVSYPTLKAIADASAASAVKGTDSNGNETTTALRTATSGRYIFANVSDYEAFTEDARSMGLSEDYAIVSSDVENYERSLVPLENLSSFATTFLVVMLAIGAVILIVINIFNIRERKYEVGVLTAIGMKKGKVAAQFILEILIITAVAMAVGTASAAAASLPVINNLLAAQVEAEQQLSANTQQNFGRPGLDAAAAGGFRGGILPGSFRNIEYLSSVDAAMDYDVLLQIAAIGVLLALLSSSAAVIYVLRYEPLRILSERS